MTEGRGHRHGGKGAAKMREESNQASANTSHFEFQQIATRTYSDLKRTNAVHVKNSVKRWPIMAGIWYQDSTG